MNEWMDEWVDGWMDDDGGMDVEKNEWMNGGMDAECVHPLRWEEIPSVVDPSV